MKVFYSWQSDLPEKHNRFFVKTCLEKAAKQLNVELLSAERPDKVEIDHDMKGVPGTPDIFATILKKIENCDLFLGDVSVVGKNDKRSLLNPNVTLELGCALSSLGDRRILLVMDAAYGDGKELPFDLTHKRHPITFSSKAKDMKKEESTLTAKLKSALEACINDLVAVRAGIGARFELVGPFGNVYRLDVYAVNQSKVTVTDYRIDLVADSEILHKTQPGYWGKWQETDQSGFRMTPANRPAVVPGGDFFSAHGTHNKIILAPGQEELAGHIQLLGKVHGRKIAITTSAPEVESQSFEFELPERQ
jgi:hypothetical protein